MKDKTTTKSEKKKKQNATEKDMRWIKITTTA